METSARRTLEPDPARQPSPSSRRSLAKLTLANKYRPEADHADALKSPAPRPFGLSLYALLVESY